MEYLIRICGRNTLICIRIHIISKEEDVLLTKIFINCVTPKSASVNVGYYYHNRIRVFSQRYVVFLPPTNLCKVCKDLFTP